MPYEELLLWISYFEDRPVGWREDLRTAYTLQCLGEKRKPDEIFPSLKSLTSKPKENVLKGSYMLQKLLSAKSGDKLKVLEEIK